MHSLSVMIGEWKQVLCRLGLLHTMRACEFEWYADPLVTQRWSRIFDQFAAVLSYGIGYISGGSLQVRGLFIIGLVRRHDPM